MPKHLGRTEPRLWTRPLRELKPDVLDDGGNVLVPATSLGFEVIEFALVVLGVELYPWQQWLLIHALELLEDGTYRFRRVIVLVGRQNGKTTLASVLAAWWLYVDSARRPDKVPPLKFKVVGVAQNLDIAREPWSAVKLWADPAPDTEEEAELALPDLQAATAKVVDTNGALSIVARSRAHYESRAGKNARGKPAARVLMDEVREQRDWIVWNAVSQTTKSFWNGMLFGFSNAGDASSVVLSKQRDVALQDLRAAGFDFPDYVEQGIGAAETYANGEDDELDEALLAEEDDVSLGLFEWSATPGCKKNDLDGILQSNPSIGYGSMTVGTCLADIRGMTDAGYRTEVLCQWVTAIVDSYIDPKDFKALHRTVEAVRQLIPAGGRTVWGIDTSHDRSMTWIAAAVMTAAGKPFVTVRVRRAGMVWAPDYIAALAEESGFKEVALRSKGCAAMEFVDKLTDLGLTVHGIEGATFGLATGRYRDRVRDEELVVVEQPDVDIAVEGGVVTEYADNLAWSPRKSMPVDIAGVIAETVALYALEVLEPEPAPPPLPPPPPSESLAREATGDYEVNLATAPF